MDGWVAGSAGPARPAPLAATGGSHAAAHASSADDNHAAARPVHALPRVPPPASATAPHLASPAPPPLGAADTQPVAAYICDTRALLDEVDAALASGEGVGGTVARRTKAWLEAQRRAVPVGKVGHPGRPGWRASAAAARPGLSALAEWWAGSGGGGGGGDPEDDDAAPPLPPAAVVEAYRVAARAARAALDVEDAAEAAGEGGL